MSLEAGLISYAALASLALSVRKYRPSQPLPIILPPSTARCSGWLLLALAAIAAILHFGAALGIIAWIGQLCVSGATFVLLLSWRPRLSYMLAVAALAAGMSWMLSKTVFQSAL